MSSAKEVVVVNGVRSAIGDYGGALKDVPPCDLASQVVAESVKRSGVNPESIGHCVFGNVIHTEARDMYLGRKRWTSMTDNWLKAVESATKSLPQPIG